MMNKKIKYVSFKTIKGDYTAYLDWSFGDRLIITVWDDDSPDEGDPRILFEREIELTENEEELK